MVQRINVLWYNRFIIDSDHLYCAELYCEENLDPYTYCQQVLKQVDQQTKSSSMRYFLKYDSITSNEYLSIFSCDNIKPIVDIIIH